MESIHLMQTMVVTMVKTIVALISLDINHQEKNKFLVKIQ